MHIHTCWVEINLAAICHNFRQVRAFVGDEVQIVAIVKADAYGHGAPAVAKALADGGANYFGVTRLEEALTLREAGITAPILLLAPPLPEQARACVQHDLTATVDDAATAQALSAAAQRRGKTVKVHLKVDSGMGRLGVAPEQVLTVATELNALPGIVVEGIFTHFANALDKDFSTTERQFERFQQTLSQLRQRSLLPPIAHCANSAALLRQPQMHLNAVRPGTVLFGQYPSPHLPRSLDLRDPFAVKCRVVSVRRLRKGATVGYGSEWRAPRDSLIATLPIGFADGFGVDIAARTETLRGAIQQSARQSLIALGRLPSPRFVILRGQRAPVVGRIGMQMCSVDVSHIPHVAVGDVATVPVRRTLVSARLPRVYSFEG
ncbi:MAG: alanine racemase [Abditibacteriales bacterium]|nr:alanine racemase [Abditibacteriales bacterium]MDW8364862.1 alanine racemase [Abditibacteriales bacterium]